MVIVADLSDFEFLVLAQMHQDPAPFDTEPGEMLSKQGKHLDLVQLDVAAFG